MVLPVPSLPGGPESFRHRPDMSKSPARNFLEGPSVSEHFTVSYNRGDRVAQDALSRLVAAIDRGALSRETREDEQPPATEPAKTAPAARNAPVTVPSR